ncbi:unannotated protein [freshwater metagenome]|uniref:Unannotated protein n=1 Tax=freshwater metagenome TaxID=449393 RepID=A0A6J6GV71_9ZZZZ
MAEHLERGAAGTDHDGGAQLGCGHRAGRKDLADFVAALEVRRERCTGIVTETAEIDDLGRAGGGGGIAEVGGREAIAFLPIAAASDRVHEVVRARDVGEGGNQRCGIEHVAGHDLDAVGPLLVGQLGGIAGDRPHAVAGLDELGDEPPSDVPGRPCDQHLAGGTGDGPGGGRWRRRGDVDWSV